MFFVASIWQVERIEFGAPDGAIIATINKYDNKIDNGFCGPPWVGIVTTIKGGYNGIEAPISGANFATIKTDDRWIGLFIGDIGGIEFGARIRAVYVNRQSVEFFWQ